MVKNSKTVPKIEEIKSNNNNVDKPTTQNNETTKETFEFVFGNHDNETPNEQPEPISPSVFNRDRTKKSRRSVKKFDL